MAPMSAADIRQCDPDLQFDVDVLILDYLVYNATKAVLIHDSSTETEPNSASGNLDHENLPQDVDTTLHLVNSYMNVFKEVHVEADVPSSLRFRLQLLRFAALFVFRHMMSTITPSKDALTALRAMNSKRADTWLAQGGEGIFPADVQADYQRLTISERDASQGFSPLPSLLDILPSFIELTSTRSNEGEWPIGEPWLELAAQMMLQAVLEQRIIYHRTGFESVKEAFAWGFEGIKGATATSEGSQSQSGLDNKSRNRDTVDTDAEMDLGYLDHADERNPHDESANIIFCHLEEDNEKDDQQAPAPFPVLQARPNPAWTHIRERHLRLIVPRTNWTPGNSPPLSSSIIVTQFHQTGLNHLRELAFQQPIAEFHAAVRSFLEAMSESVAKPILTQLEQLSATDGMPGIEDGGAPFEINVDFERLQIDGDEARELRKLALEVQGLK